MCGWEHGRYSFYEGTRYQGEKIDLELSMPELWVRAARTLSERVILRRFGDMLHQIVVGFDAGVVDLCNDQLNGDERVALTAFDGNRSAVQVVTAESGNSGRRRAVLTVLYLLSELGGIRMRAAGATDTRPPAPTPSR